LQTETRSEQFHSSSVIGALLRKLHIDIPLFIGLFLTCALSFLILYSAGGQEIGVLTRQATRIGVAFVLMIILAHINPRQFHRHSAVLYVFGVLLLIAVLVAGQVGKGAQRWLDLGLFRFQPSEMIKITTPMMIAWFLSGYTLPPKPKQFFIAALLIVFPTLLIAKQPDLGTSLLVASSGAAVLFFAGLSWRFMIAKATSSTIIRGCFRLLKSMIMMSIMAIVGAAILALIPAMALAESSFSAPHASS